MSEVLSSIRIPELVYVGFQGRRAVDQVPLGFMTPYTEDKAGQKRRDTVDSWARGRWGSNKTFNSVKLENKPMIGFKIGRQIRRSGGWNGSGASYVRVEDPRGFELEITIENLVMCMKENIIEDGEILTECVWGRDGNRNILLPTNSEPYRASLRTVERINAAVTLRDINPGDEIELLDGTKGVYYGGMYGLMVSRYMYQEELRSMEATNKRYVLEQKDGNKTRLKGYASIKVAKIINKAEKKWTPEEIENRVRELVAKDAKVCSDESYGNWGKETRYWLTSDKYEVQGMVRSVFDEASAEESRKNEQWLALFIESSSTGRVIDISDTMETNFAEKNKPNRGYYKNRNSYSWHHNHIGVGDAFIGAVSTIGDETVSRTGDTGHVERNDVKEIFGLTLQVKAKTGLIYDVKL
jgi:hypothetical protein